MERWSDKKRRNGIITGKVFHIHVYMHDNLTKVKYKYVLWIRIIFSLVYIFQLNSRNVLFWIMYIMNGLAWTLWWPCMCSGYGSWIITTHQEQLISFIQSTGPGEHPLRAALKPRYITSQHTIHQASEEIISQIIALKPRLYIHIVTVTKHPNTNNVSPWRTAVTDNCVGLWFRSTMDYG